LCSNSSGTSFHFDAKFPNRGTLILVFSSGSSNAGGQWAAGDEPLYYIVSPKDIVVAKPRFVKILQSKSSFFKGKSMSSYLLNPILSDCHFEDLIDLN